MSAAALSARTGEGSPRLRGRLAGLFEALEGLTSAYGQVFILGGLVVSGDAAATAARILGHERLFWFGFALSLVGVACHVVWALLFYELFKPVNGSIALLAAFVTVVVCAMQAVTALLYAAPMLILKGGSSLSGLTTPQQQALAFVFLKVNGQAFNVDLVFFGLSCFLTGYLIFRSTFMPRILGVLLAIDGLGWMTYLYPPLATRIFPFIAVASGLAEIPLQLWLLIAGVNPERWKEQARTAMKPPAGA